MMSVYQDGAWTTPQRAPFTNNSSCGTSISHDGKQLFFGSYRGTAGSAGVWQCTKTEDGSWSDPVEMNRQISSTAYEFSCHISDLGNMFVCSWRDGGLGGCDGWRIPYVNGEWQQAENLKTLNSSDGDCCFVPGPEEKYLIFQTRRPLTGNPGGFFDCDLFISYATSDRDWTPPQNLGPAINSSAAECGPWISYDGRYLFFSSDRRGTHDIYWVSVEAFLDTSITSIHH
jgi:Tol biopolymer transport system component